MHTADPPDGEVTFSQIFFPNPDVQPEDYFEFFKVNTDELAKLLNCSSSPATPPEEGNE